MRCFFVADLHGRLDRYRKLLALVAEERPELVLLGGDLLPQPFDRGWQAASGHQDFLAGYLAGALAELAGQLGPAYPAILAILGNDDPRSEEPACLALEEAGLWRYAHGRRLLVQGRPVYGYSCVPPSPFQLKDWECYDVSRYVDPGCVSPEAGWRSVPVPPERARYGTIQRDLAALVGEDDLAEALLLCHSPPYGTALDRAALDGRAVDHAPLDPHCGSIAIRRLIEARAPRVTLHGHIHESARLTGAWRERLGGSHCFSAAHDGPELALVRFDPARPEAASRTLY